MTDPTTIDHSIVSTTRSAAPRLNVTILWHPSLRRIGATASVPLAAASLSRKAPIFSDGLPLADARVSRSPIRFLAGSQGVEVRPDRAGQRFTVSHQPGVAGMRLSGAQLDAGVVVGLGKQGPLVLIDRAPRAPAQGHGLIGVSAALNHVRRLIDAFAAHSQPVLIVGPTGTGKELVSQALHAASARAEAPMVAVNMATIGAGTADSELFGHARGSFTGATTSASGLFVQANGGTLFLDEIGACSTETQAKLLRTLETGTVRPVGGRERAVDVRVLAATDANLDQDIAEGRFRSALYFRLAHSRISIPPLRERPADILPQFLHFLRAAVRIPEAAEGGEPWLSHAHATQLLRHPWPGNTRELRAVAQQAAILYGSAPLCGPLALADAPPQPDAGAAPAVEMSEEERILAALAACDYRIRETAARLGVSRNTLRRRMAALNLPRAQNVTADQIQAAMAAAADLPSAARQLRISAHSLKLRIRELGLDVS